MLAVTSASLSLANIREFQDRALASESEAGLDNTAGIGQPALAVGRPHTADFLGNTMFL